MFKVPSLYLDPINAISLYSLVSVIIAILSYYIECRYPLFNDNYIPIKNIIFLRFIHIFIFLVNISYIFVCDISCDLGFIILTSLVTYHWIFMTDYNCILNLFERNYYDNIHCINNHVSCDNIYMRTILRDYTNIIFLIAGILFMFNYIIVVLRLKHANNNVKIALLLLFIVYIIIFQLIYRRYRFQQKKSEQIRIPI